MKSLDADRGLVERKLDILAFAEEVFFDKGDFVTVVNFLG